MIQIRVRYYQKLREIAGTHEEILFADEGANLGNLLLRIFARHPEVRPLENSLLFACNSRYAFKEELLSDGDVVDLMPPFSGG
jgi:MoaD family protein